MKYFIQLIIFYRIFNFILLLEFISTLSFTNKIQNYIQIYNSTIFSEIYLVTRVNIIKQFFYNSNITNYGFEEDAMKNNLLYAFLFMSQEIEPTLKELSKTNSFLENEYKDLFKQYYYSNFTELIKDEITNFISNRANSGFIEYFRYGFASINLRIFEILRYLNIKYFMNPDRNLEKNVSSLINHDYWHHINILLINIVRPWYKKINSLISSYYDSYTKQRLNYYMFAFVILLVLISLYYWIGWKHYENEFIDSIKKSFDLINLIPEEIKNIIINKLNEN